MQGGIDAQRSDRGMEAMYSCYTSYMDDDMKQRMTMLEQKIDAIYATTEKTRKYFLWTMIITIALVVLPAIGLVFAIPSFISSYSQIGDITQLQ